MIRIFIRQYVCMLQKPTRGEGKKPYFKHIRKPLNNRYRILFITYSYMYIASTTFSKHVSKVDVQGNSCNVNVISREKNHYNKRLNNNLI